MSNVVMALMATLGVDTSNFDEGLKKSESKANKFGSSLKKGLAVGAKTAVAGITALTTATSAGAVALGKGISSVSEFGDSIQKTSQKVGLSTKSYQEWDYVMTLAGTSMSNMTTGLKTLTNKLDDAKGGSKDAQAMFAKLGISMKDINTMSREDLFAKTITGFQGMADSTERAALANDLFGRSGQELTPLFNQSAELTQEQIKNANEYGMVMSDEAVQGSADFQDSLTTMTRTLGGLKNSMLGELLPASTTVMNGLTKVFTGDTQKGLEDINSGVGDFTDKLTEIVPKLLDIGGTVVSALITSISQNSGKILESAVTLLKTIISALIDSISANLGELVSASVSILRTLLEAIIENLPIVLQAGLLLIQELGQTLIDLAPMLLESAISLLTMLANFLAENVDEMIPSIIELILSLAEILTRPDILMPLIESAGEILVAVGKGLGQAIPVLIKYVPTIIENIVSLLKQGFPVIITAIGGLVVELGRSVGDGLYEIFGTSLYDKLKGAMDTIKEKITSVKEFFSTQIQNIKGFFEGLVLKLPEIKLPHFKLEGSFSLNPPSVPKLGIDWYAKGYDEAYMLNSATIFGAQGGKLLGGGERAGSEVVVGTQKLISMMSTAVRNAFDGIVLQADIPVYIGNKKLEDIIVKTQATMKIKRGK